MAPEPPHGAPPDPLGERLVAPVCPALFARAIEAYAEAAHDGEWDEVTVAEFWGIEAVLAEITNRRP